MNIAAILSQDASTYYEAGSVAVREQLERHGWQTEHEVEQAWTGFMAKIRWAHRCARELTQYTHLMLVDARDVVLLAGPDEVMERFLEFDCPWVCSAEPFVWPQGMFPEERYPECDTPYRFLNSGGYIAEREHLLDCLDRWPLEGIEFKDVRRYRGEDGSFFTEFYLNEPGSIVLDHECRIFQCMCGSQVGDDPLVQVSPGKVYNRMTNTSPVVIHYNGGGNIASEENRVLWEL